jgi:beta-glucosidase
VVEPQLTVALTDDTRFGYLAPDTTRPLPSGATVTYTSNRPTVATVDNGVIRATAPGVATITARFTYAATTTSTTFALTVHP